MSLAATIRSVAPSLSQHAQSHEVIDSRISNQVVLPAETAP
jgi:hypothetical protein